MNRKNATGGGLVPVVTKSVVLAGATALVGESILKGLLADGSVAAIHALGRREPGILHPKLIPHVVDFKALPSLPPVDEVYLALGTTIKEAGSQGAFRAVDFDANLLVARRTRRRCAALRPCQRDGRGREVAHLLQPREG